MPDRWLEWSGFPTGPECRISIPHRELPWTGSACALGAANRQFIQDRIAEVEARGPATEQEKITRMAKWRYFGMLYPDNTPIYNNNRTEERTENRFRQIRCLAEVSALEEDALPIFAGVFQRQTEEWAAAEGDDHPRLIPCCEELGRFLTCAHEVADPDFRRSGVAPFEAGPDVMSGLEEILAEEPDSSVQREQYHECVRQECARLRENLEDDHISRLINKISIIASPDCDMEVNAGLVTGECYVGHYPGWYSTSLYCRQRPDDGEDRDTEEEGEEVPDSRNIQD
ncbi:hypothetical protein BDV26DRAFT_295582 [Aspergillus bertholletiae]|uniref:Uncharacterized protein n=1 Tax=Aspergillus bertholletiae TaxID=1226010 RepID=A0A5N7B116_9EURO|nr:hypothetical protein BDV26DRAFT_295582 [Aspergillus bertholletiae]